jgi:hypothetical protein
VAKFISEKVREYLRYALRGKYNGPDVAQIRMEMQPGELQPQESVLAFATVMKHYYDKQG